MSQKQEWPFFRPTFDKLSASFRQVQETISRFIGIVEQSLFIGQEKRFQNTRPIPIEIFAEPEIIEKIKVKIRW